MVTNRSIIHTKREQKRDLIITEKKMLYFIMENHTYNGDYIYCIADEDRGFNNGLNTFDYCYLPKTAGSDLEVACEIVREINERYFDAEGVKLTPRKAFRIMRNARDIKWGNEEFRFADYQIADVLSYNYPEWADEFKRLAEKLEVA